MTPRAAAPLLPLATIIDTESRQVEESDAESVVSSVHPLAAKSQEEKLAHLAGQLDGAGQGHLLQFLDELNDKEKVSLLA